MLRFAIIDINKNGNTRLALANGDAIIHDESEFSNLVLTNLRKNFPEDGAFRSARLSRSEVVELARNAIAAAANELKKETVKI